MIFVLIFLVSFARAAAPSAFDAFLGKWAGTLEYQDFRKDKRVTIPVALEVKTLDASSATWNFVYDDFGTTVQSFETHTWKPNRYTMETRGRLEKQRYSSFDFARLLQNKTGLAVLFGTELENGKTIEVRRTIRLGPRSLRTLKKVRAAKDQAFTFRNQSTYTRQ